MRICFIKRLTLWVCSLSSLSLFVVRSEDFRHQKWNSNLDDARKKFDMISDVVFLVESRKRDRPDEESVRFSVSIATSSQTVRVSFLFDLSTNRGQHCLFDKPFWLMKKKMFSIIELSISSKLFSFVFLCYRERS